jgi:hypothetical protein
LVLQAAEQSARWDATTPGFGQGSRVSTAFSDFSYGFYDDEDDEDDDNDDDEDDDDGPDGASVTSAGTRSVSKRSSTGQKSGRTHFNQFG